MGKVMCDQINWSSDCNLEIPNPRIPAGGHFRQSWIPVLLVSQTWDFGITKKNNFLTVIDDKPTILAVKWNILCMQKTLLWTVSCISTVTATPKFMMAKWLTNFSYHASYAWNKSSMASKRILLTTKKCKPNPNKKFELMLARHAKVYSSSWSHTVSLFPAISLQFILGVCAAAADRRNQQKLRILEVRGLSKSSFLIWLKSLSLVLVVIGSTPMVICIRFHERLANNGKIMTFTGVPLFGALVRRFSWT